MFYSNEVKVGKEDWWMGLKRMGTASCLTEGSNIVFCHEMNERQKTAFGINSRIESDDPSCSAPSCSAPSSTDAFFFAWWYRCFQKISSWHTWPSSLFHSSRKHPMSKCIVFQTINLGHFFLRVITIIGQNDRHVRKGRPGFIVWNAMHLDIGCFPELWNRELGQVCQEDIFWKMEDIFWKHLYNHFTLD